MAKPTESGKSKPPKPKPKHKGWQPPKKPPKKWHPPGHPGPGGTPDPGAEGNQGQGVGEPPVNPFGWWGLPPDVTARVLEILKGANGEELALQYIRTTPWYAEHYAGIQQGVANGIFADAAHPEAAYIAYKNDIIQSYNKYYGRLPTMQEIASMLAQGWSAQTVELKGQGHAWVGANRGEVSYLSGAFGTGQLSEEDLQSLGEESKGLHSTTGEKLQTALETAQTKMRKAFEGLSGSSTSLEQSLGTITQRKRSSDVGA